MDEDAGGMGVAVVDVDRKGSILRAPFAGLSLGGIDSLFFSPPPWSALSTSPFSSPSFFLYSALLSFHLAVPRLYSQSRCPQSESSALDPGPRRAVFCLLHLSPPPGPRFWLLMHRWIPPRQPVPLQIVLTPAFYDRLCPSPQSLSFWPSPSLPLFTSRILQASPGFVRP